MIGILFSAAAFGENGDTVGPWQIQTSTSLLDDSSSSAIVSVASESQGAFLEKPGLLVACVRKKLVFALVLHGESLSVERIPPYSRPVAHVRLRHDKEKVYRRFAIPTADVALLEVSEKQMAADLSRTSLLTVGLKLSAGEEAVAVFPVDHFVEAVKLFGGTCHTQ